jgi:predicted house-cleaning noncanonical NTP pyrophosphatase (MazG superfamily)
MARTRTFRLDKLVRDKIVESTQQQGGTVKFRILKGDELTKALLTKLIEEANELKTNDLSVGELADLKELVEALATHLGTSANDLAKSQTEKRRRNGAFKKGHFINTVTLPADNKWAKYYAADPKRFPEIKP